MAVDLSLDRHTAVITLNNPASRNCLSSTLVMEMHRVLDEPDVRRARAIVIAAHGPAFCAGADINDLLKSGWMEGRSQESSPVRLFRRIASHPRPVIAAVHGMALGGGAELMLSCDLAVASPDASIALPELGHGVVPNTGLALLVSMVGRRRALDLMLTRRRVSAEEALQLGLVNMLVPRAALRASAIALADSIVADAPPGALAEIKNSLNRHAATDWNEVDACLARLPMDEWQEGLSAFTERRRPNYQTFWEDS
jgi:enoyl-CoA hydratase